MLAFERQLDKVKTRLTTLYVVQKLIIIITTIIFDQLKVCKLKWIPMLTHKSLVHIIKVMPLSKLTSLGVTVREGRKKLFFPTSRLKHLWPHFHDNLSGVIVHIYNRNTEVPHLGPPIKIISNNIQRGILTIVLYLCSKCWMTWNCEPSCV